MRESPSLDIIPELVKLKGNVSAFDPVAVDEAKKHIKNVKFCYRIEDCVKDTDCVILLTEWSEFRSLSPKFFKSLMKGNLIIDFRNALNRESFKDSKFNLYQIGRRKILN